MNKKIIVPLATIIILIVGVIGGGSYFISNQKKQVKPEAQKQVASIDNFQLKLNKITELYQETQTPTNGKQVNVLGASSKKKSTPAEKATEHIAQVLGIEDSESMKKSREIVELYTQTQEELLKIKDTNKNISAIANTSILKQFGNITIPTSETDTLITNITPIVLALKQEEDLTIKAYTEGVDLGATLQLAIMRADEASVIKLEEKIKTLSTLSDEEAKIVQSNIPTELKDILGKSVEQGKKLIVQLNDIPSIIRKRDAVALQKALTNMVVDSGVDSIKVKVQLVSFMKNNETIRSTNTVKENWSNVVKGL